MKVCIFTFTLCICFFLIYTVYLNVSDATIQKEWNNFKTVYMKNYSSKEEEEHRFRIFHRNLKQIERHNENYLNHETSFKKAVNRYTDLTDTEFAVSVKIDGDLAHPLPLGFRNERYLSLENETQTPPPKADWRERGVVGRVKDQGHCGSCWSFSAVAAIESQLAIKTGHVTHLSEQNLIDCSRRYYNEGCDGGTPSWAYDYVIKKGVASEESYPYKAEDGECQEGATFATKISGYYHLPSTSEKWLQYFVGVKGPVSVCIHATVELQFYASGVFRDNSCSSYNMNHCVIVVGYSTDDQQNDYWILKNSWGSEWGQGGYFYLARNADNMCAVAREPTFPFL